MRTMPTFELEVSYGQLAVFDAWLASPFCDWAEAHVCQGFAWRPGTVSFATLAAAGPISVTVLAGPDALDAGPDALDACPDALVERAIRVPFTVPAHGGLELSSIGDAVELRLPPGDHALTFRHGRTPVGMMVATLRFEPADVPVTASILVTDPALAPPVVLVMTAEPA